MSIFARSPYIVEIAETGQDGSKLEVFIWILQYDSYNE